MYFGMEKVVVEMDKEILHKDVIVVGVEQGREKICKVADNVNNKLNQIMDVKVIIVDENVVEKVEMDIVDKVLDFNFYVEVIRNPYQTVTEKRLNPISIVDVGIQGNKIDWWVVVMVENGEDLENFDLVVTIHIVVVPLAWVNYREIEGKVDRAIRVVVVGIVEINSFDDTFLVVEQNFHSIREIKHRILVVDAIVDHIAVGKHVVVISTKIVSVVPDPSVAHVSLPIVKVWVAHVIINTMAQVQEDLEIVSTTLEPSVELEKVGYEITNVVSFIKMVPVALANMATIVRQSMQV